MNPNRQIRYGLLVLLTVALITNAACDQLKNVYCTNVLPALSKPCSQPTPATVPLAEVK